METREVQSITLEEAMELNPIGYFQYRLLLMCGLTFMTDGFEITLLSFLTACVGIEWELTNTAKATLTGMVFMGIVICSLFFGWFADKYGRRPAYLYACLLITSGGFLSAIAPSYWFLVLFRTITGFGIGGASVPFLASLSSRSVPSHHRAVLDPWIHDSGSTCLVHVKHFGLEVPYLCLRRAGVLYLPV